MFNPEAVESQKERCLDLNAKIQDVVSGADAEGRDLTDEESSMVDAAMTEVAKIQAQIERRAKIEAQSAALSAIVAPKSDPAAATAAAPVARAPARQVEIIDAAARGSHGFNSFGNYLSATIQAGLPNGKTDPRLFGNAPTTYGQEKVGQDGGFLVPPDFRTSIQSLYDSEETLLSRTDQWTTNSNRLEVPVDEDSAWSTSGIVPVWAAEASQLTQKKPVIKNRGLQLHKLTTLIPLTEEVMEDAMVLERYVTQKAVEKIGFELDRTLIHGTGSGQPLGLLNSNALISVAKESGQAADTLNFENIVKMWSRCYAPSRRNAVWLINQDVEPQLMRMAFQDTAAGGPVYLPGPHGNVADAPFGSLMGRPVIPHQVCETVGDLGDIMLVDFNQYITARKTVGIRTDVSMHLYFDYDVTALRMVLRIAGEPWWNSTLASRDGSNTLSPYVALAARA